MYYSALQSIAIVSKINGQNLSLVLLLQILVKFYNIVSATNWYGEKIVVLAYLESTILNFQLQTAMLL